MKSGIWLVLCAAMVSAVALAADAKCMHGNIPCDEYAKKMEEEGKKIRSQATPEQRAEWDRVDAQVKAEKEQAKKSKAPSRAGSAK